MDSIQVPEAASRPPERWVSMGEACKILGVRPATVRRWAGSGRIKAFVTPGGHRRFKVGELLRFAGESALTGGADGSRLGNLTAAGQVDAITEARRQSWYEAFDARDMEENRARGRAILQLIEAYLSADECRPSIVAQVTELAAEYGRQAARLHLSLRELLAAFHLFRRPLIAAIDRMEFDDAGSGRGMFALVTDLLDAFTTAMVEAYLQRALEPVVGRSATAPRRTSS